MTGPELRAIRVRLALTPSQLADSIKVKRNSIYRYEREHRPISRQVEAAVRLLVELHSLRQASPAPPFYA